MGRASLQRTLVHALCLAVGVGNPQPAATQDVVLGDSAPSCATCSIELRPVLSLDGRTMFLVNEPYEVIAHRDGGWLVTSLLDPTEIFVFDSTSRLVKRIGREGQGPGEYRFIRSVRVGPGDTVWVFDWDNQRITVLSPELGLVRSRRVDLGTPNEVALLSDGRFVTVEDRYRAANRGLPLHFMDGGKQTLSFGADPDDYPGRWSHRLWRFLAPDRSAGFWAAHMTQYRLEHWNSFGKMDRSIERRVPWFEPNERVGIDYDNPTRPPNPGLFGVRLDVAGHLWTVIHVADANWRDGTGQVEGMYGRTIQGIRAPNAYRDTIVEVIDPTRGTLLASARFDPVVQFAGSSSFAWSYREDENGYPVIDLFELVLSGVEGPGPG